MTFAPLRRMAACLLLAAGLAAAAGCSSPSPDGSTSASGSVPGSGSASASASAPEDQRAVAAEVAAGLRKIEALARDIATASTGTAQGLIDQIEPAWQRIEGTVKANDPDVYLALEDSFAQLAKAVQGDAATVARGAATVAATVAAYLARYPG